MNKIGFKNFRRFQEFPDLNYGPITFLVGKNNSGKSTMVKAIILINEFIKSLNQNIEKFSFVNNILEDVNIMTYGRAKNVNSPDNFITFNFRTYIYSIEIVISGEENSTEADVHLCKILNTENGYEFILEPKTMTITLNRKNIDGDINLTDLNERKKLIEERIVKLNLQIKNLNINYVDIHSTPDNPINYMIGMSIGGEIDELKNKIKSIEALETEKKINVEYQVSTIISDDTFILVNKIGSFYSYFIHLINKAKFISRNLENETENRDFQFYKQNTIAINQLNIEYDNIKSSLESIDRYFSSRNIIYLGSYSSKQSALFAIRDKNNPLAQAIHHFYQLKEIPVQSNHAFISYWMKEFEIGEFFEIILHAGESYEVNIQSNNTSVPLADKGMGAIQIMLLLFRIAVILSKSSRSYADFCVILEEPELNLHPALQSKLADLFHRVYKEYKIEFIVETHSEYLIRRTQVLYLNNIGEILPFENPFSVIYFPKNKLPYNMEYKEDGTFKNNFGEGFFDAASISTLELIKIRREREN